MKNIAVIGAGISGLAVASLLSRRHRVELFEIVRFNREAPALLAAPDAERQTLGDFLESRRFGEGFTHRYLFPMASAIWSASLDAIRSFPALTLMRFFENHGLLSLGVNRTHYCGAYWFHGFHEDGLNSARRVAGALRVQW